MPQRSNSFFGIRPNERRLVLRLASLHFLVITSYTVARASRDALFLETLTSRGLPYLYVGVALWTALVSVVYSRLGFRQQMPRALSQLLLGCGVALAIFGAVMWEWPGAVSSVAFYLWTGAYGLIVVSVFWVLANEAIDPREAKRLFGIIGAGGILGGALGGVLATVFGGILGPEAMLFVAGALLMGAAPLARYAIDPGSSRILDLPRGDVPPRNWRRDPYVVLLSTLFLLTGVCASLVDYQFKVAVERVSSGDRLQLTRLLGSYHAVLNALAIVLQVFTAGWLLRRVGAVAVAGLLPAGIAIGSLAAIFAPGAPVLIAATRMYDAGLRNSIVKTAWEFFYFPLPPVLRRRVRAWIEAVVDRTAEAAAGLLILAFGALHVANPEFLGGTTVVLAIMSILLGLQLRVAYVQQLSTNLRTLVDEPQPEAPSEARLIEEAHRLLESPFEKRALYAFELLERADPEGLDRRLGELQAHPSPAIRARVLGRLADPDRPVASPLLATIAHDESAEVRTAGFRLFAEQYADAEEHMEKLLDSEDEASRAAALSFLVSRPTSSVAQVNRRVDEVLRSGSVEERRALAVGLGRRPRAALGHDRLVDLLRDPSPVVRREALAAFASAGLRRLAPAMLPSLATPATRDAARTALAAFGDRIVGSLGDTLVDPATPPALQREIPSVLAQVGTQAAANELLRVPPTLDVRLRMRVLQAQNRIRTRRPEVRFPRSSVHAALDHEVESFLRIHVHLDVWRREPESRTRKVLYESLIERRDAAFDRIFRQLALVYPPREIYVGYRAFVDTARRPRAQALEYLDAALLPEDRRLLVPILEEPERRAILAEALYGILPYTRDSSLADLLAGSDSWLQACALYVIGTERIAGLRDRVVTALDTGTATVQETAAWTLRRLEDA